MVGHDEVAERLLRVMDAKDHWAWPRFAQGAVPLARLEAHFRAEWEVYVRDFPALLARVLGRCPPPAVRAALATNLYEEQTGGLSGTTAHPELFLRMMEACGYSRARFAAVELGPAARRYRDFLDAVTFGGPWIVGCAVLTIFVEGSVNERRELATEDVTGDAPEAIEEAVRRHPLVRVHGVDPAAMELVRVHRRVERGHRHDAWRSVLEHLDESSASAVERALGTALACWLAYRDEVAATCGIVRP